MEGPGLGPVAGGGVVSRRTYYTALSGDLPADPAGFALPPVRSVVLDRAKALEEDAREAEGDRGDIVDTDLNDILYECVPAGDREGE